MWRSPRVCLGSRENLLGSAGQQVNRTGRTAAAGFRSQLLHSHSCVASSRFSTLCSAWTVSYQMTESYVCIICYQNMTLFFTGCWKNPWTAYTGEVLSAWTDCVGVGEPMNVSSRGPEHTALWSLASWHPLCPTTYGSRHLMREGFRYRVRSRRAGVQGVVGALGTSGKITSGHGFGLLEAFGALWLLWSAMVLSAWKALGWKVFTFWTPPAFVLRILWLLFILPRQAKAPCLGHFALSSELNLPLWWLGNCALLFAVTGCLPETPLEDKSQAFHMFILSNSKESGRQQKPMDILLNEQGNQEKWKPQPCF